MIQSFNPESCFFWLDFGKPVIQREAKTSASPAISSENVNSQTQPRSSTVATRLPVPEASSSKNGQKQVRKSAALPFKAFVKKSNVIFTKLASRELGEGERTACEFSCLTFFSKEEQRRAMNSGKDLVPWGATCAPRHVDFFLFFILIWTL